VTGDWNPNELLGTQLGSCVLERSIGIGGMGAVYLAQQSRPRRQVALKVLRPGRATSPEAWQNFLTRFAREADLAAGLDHANIVPIFEFGQQGDTAFLVMPYLADGSLADLLARMGRLSLADAAAYIDQAAAALDYAHQRGLVHRDVKPSNLLLHPDGRLMLADFGIARPADRITGDTGSRPGLGTQGDPNRSEAGQAAGTPEYMAPEQIRGGPLIPATDIYALGIVAYAMLAGQTPFADVKAHLVLARQLHEVPLPLRTLRPDIPQRADEVIAWALAKDPAARPQSAGDFARALRQATTRSRPLSGFFTRAEGAGDAPRGMLRLAGMLSGPPPQMSRGSRASAPSAPVAAVPRAAAPVPPRFPPPVPRRANGTQPLTPSGSSRISASSISTPAVAGPLDAPPLPDASLPGVGPPNMAGTSGQFSGFRDDNTPTIFDPGAFPRGEVPAWTPSGRSFAPPSARVRRHVSIIKPVAAALVAVVGFIVLLGGLSQSGLFAAPSGPRTGLPAPTFGPTATTLPTATPTIPPNWLSVTPTSLNLTCRGKTNQQNITIRNLGNDTLSWLIQADGFTGLNFSKMYGTIPAGKQVTVTVSNANHSFQSITGSFDVDPQSDNSGDSVTVNYTVQSCLFGGARTRG